MIKIYRKTGVIEAEQFDGSNEMVDKYHIKMVDGDYAEDYSMLEIGPAPYVRYFLTRFDLAKEIFAGDWIATGINGEHWTITDDTLKQKYAELPVIPCYVAEYIDAAKNNQTWLNDPNIAEAIVDVVEHGGGSAKLASWIEWNGDSFARAWLDGYQTEE